mmetsp:Transcript_97918/g.261302  ORF Transcript_97918/g.261302 Transcript_97918/m.261302 type:complete len:245 (+) Transcript_97918:721-1455(+)
MRTKTQQNTSDKFAWQVPIPRPDNLWRNNLANLELLGAACPSATALHTAAEGGNQLQDMRRGAALALLSSSTLARHATGEVTNSFSTPTEPPARAATSAKPSPPQRQKQLHHCWVSEDRLRRQRHRVPGAPAPPSIPLSTIQQGRTDEATITWLLDTQSWERDATGEGRRGRPTGTLQCLSAKPNFAHMAFDVAHSTDDHDGNIGSACGAYQGMPCFPGPAELPPSRRSGQRVRHQKFTYRSPP